MENKPLNSTLETELTSVIAQLEDVAQQLDEPLNQLVLSQVRRAAPHRRAAVVLAFGIGDDDDVLHVSRRVALAAALEMLYIAQRVHQLLLDQDTESMDKSLMGSIILAGDFCFSRAADLAVRTENPGIVAVFSTALKRLSEDNLREIFDKNERDAYSDMELLASGIEAALLLAGTAPSPGHPSEDGARRWANKILSGATNAVSDDSVLLNTHQQQRISQLLSPS